MAWYRTGTISVTNGNTAVTGSGTAWIANAQAGEALYGPDGRIYEIASINSDTSLTLGSAYLGSTVSGQAYVIVPSQSYLRDLAAQAAALVNNYASVITNAGTGQFGDGTVSAPGVRFITEPGMGMRRVSAGTMALTVGGADAVQVQADGLHAGSNSFTNSGFAGAFAGAFNGTVGATTPAAGTFTAVSASTLAGSAVATLSDMVAGVATNKATTPAAVSGYINNILGLATAVNDIGTPGTLGFGVGICPNVPAGFTPLPGHTMPGSDTYGNYQYSDGSVMVYIPAFWYKYGTGSNGLAANAVDIKPFSYFASESAANTAGYAIHRAFYNGGSIRLGVFVDKYLCSNNNNIASSIKHGIPLASAQRGSIAATAFSSLTGSPANAYYGAIAAAKTRGARFFCNTRFIRAALALLSLAHGNASTSTMHNAWYSSGSSNFPKGCNNNALGDSNDGSLVFTYDGNGTYSAACKTGSANYLDRTTHNGQTSGVTDLNGTLWEIELGLTSDGSNYYLLKTTTDVATITGGNSSATDAWGATGLSAMYDNIGATYESMVASSSFKYFGSSNQVLSAAVSGTAWNASGAGIPLATGTGGSNQYGYDGLWDYRPNELCVISGGSWDYGGSAGVWALFLAHVRSISHYFGGLRAASYL